MIDRLALDEIATDRDRQTDTKKDRHALKTKIH